MSVPLKLKCFRWAFLAALASALSATKTEAAVLAFSDNSGDPASASVSPGGSVTFTVSLQSNTPFAGLSLYLRDPAFSASAQAAITNRTTLGGSNPFSSPITNDTITNEPVDDQTVDLGYFSSSNIKGVQSYALETLTMTVGAGVSPGSTITLQSTSGSSLFDLSANEIPLAGASYVLNVVSVPEPELVSTIFAIGAIVWAPRERRR